MIKKWFHKRERSQLVALQNGLTSLRANFVEAVEKGEVIETPGAKSWVRACAFHVLALERQVDSLLHLCGDYKQFGYGVARPEYLDEKVDASP